MRWRFVLSIAGGRCGATPEAGAQRPSNDREVLVRGTLATIVYDNFGGSRRFLSPGWRDGRVVWTRDTTEAGSRLETFTYQRLSDSAYWYAWHVRRADGAPVILGDSATCRRR